MDLSRIAASFSPAVCDSDSLPIADGFQSPYASRTGKNQETDGLLTGIASMLPAAAQEIAPPALPQQQPAPRAALGEQVLPLTGQEALEEANRCLYCYDAPCTHACPTHIDIPRFIKKIATGNLAGSARAIFEANLLGATCARVCPVQELCEGACVLGPSHKPISIGRLQRYSMDHAYARSLAPFPAAAATGRKFAVIGAGPAGLSCAGELRRRGHSVTVFDRRALPGGLSTYGIIGLREPVEVALAEAALVERAGVEIRLGFELGRNLSLADLQAQFEAVVLSVGLGDSPPLGIEGEEYMLDGLRYIERSKIAQSEIEQSEIEQSQIEQSEIEKSQAPFNLPESAAEAIVIGAGNTAIDCATIAKRCGSRRVTIVYRRTEREMTAYRHEYEFAKQEGIEFRFLTQPVAVLHEGGRVTGLACLRVELGGLDQTGRPAPKVMAGPPVILEAGLVVKAIGQVKPALAALLNLETRNGFICVNERFETSTPGIYAIGDCVRAWGAASTVMAVQDGKLGAAAIHG